MKRFMAKLLTVTILLSMLMPVALAAETAVTMRLAATEGTVTVTNKSGKKITLSDNMKLYNAYNVITSAKSYAYISLDNSKAIKMDAGTQIEIRKSGKKLEIHLLAGRIFCDVKAPLSKDETLNIKTSTTVTGIRGTSLCVSLLEDKIEIQLYSGEVMTIVDGSGQGFGLSAGQKLTLGDEAAEEAIEKLSTGDVPGFVAALIAGDPALEQIFKDIDLDSAQLINEAEDLIKKDEEAQGEKDVYYPPEPAQESSQSSGSGSGSGSGSSSGSSSGSGSTPAATYKVTYDGNTNNSGTVPSDSTSYTSGTSVTVLGNTGTLTKTGHVFAGWNTSSVGTGTSYAAGETFAITGNITLYAKWVDAGDGSSGNPFKVATPGDLQRIGTDTWALNKYYEQVANINMSGVSNWIPIAPGTGSQFSGVYDGGGYTITNLEYTVTGGTGEIHAGLFGYVSGTVTSVRLSTVKIDIGTTGDVFAGGIVGSSGGTIENCTVTNVTIDATGDDVFAGGIAGGSYNITIDKCAVKTVTITASGTAPTYVGGVIGQLYNTSLLTNSMADGVNVAAYSSDSSFAGGVVGQNVSGTIKYCYAAGSTVSAVSNMAGGIAGGSNQPLTNCVSLIPGIVIKRTGDGTLTNCYAVSSGGGIIATDIITESDYKSATSASWWENTAKFDPNVWNIVNNALPTLK